MSKLFNPFPGLRPFNASEEHLFFGRESQVDAMVDRLGSSRFLAVVGPSGSGKSSLVDCGLRPALIRGLLSQAGTSWRVAKFRPGSDPIQSLTRALAADGLLFKDFPGSVGVEEVIDTQLRMSKRGLIELFRKARLPKNTNLLIIADQFEELFRYSSVSGKASDSVDNEAARAFVNLLLEPHFHRAENVYVVLTMRSDFLGDCARFRGLPEAINDSQYLVPRMTRTERRSAIVGPVLVAGGDIEPVLLTRLVNDVGDNPDQLSILQHALNRTWAKWNSDENEAISLDDYEKIGTMKRALDSHATDAYRELKKGAQRELASRIFKALTDKGTDVRGIRRPTRFDVLCKVVDAEPDEVRAVIEVFRHPSRSFLMPPVPDEIHDATVIDISHESLMRVWTLLEEWADHEALDAAQYRRLVQTAVLHAGDRADLMSGVELKIARDWWKKVRPNRAWAERYRKGFEEAQAFLNKSEKARKRSRVFRRLKWVGIGAAVIVSSVYSFLSSTTYAEYVENLKYAADAYEAIEEQERVVKSFFDARVAVQTAEFEVVSAEAEVTAARKALKDATSGGRSGDSKALSQALQKAEEEAVKAEDSRQDAETMLAFTAVVAADGWAVNTSAISSTDLFDVSTGVVVTKTSGVSGDSGPRMFGGVGACTGCVGGPADPSDPFSENAATFFADGKPVNFRHEIEWRLPQAESIKSINLFAIHDGPIGGFRYRRGMNNFRFSVKVNDMWKEVAVYSPVLPYGADVWGRDPKTVLSICLDVDTAGQEFRAEFQQAVDVLGQFSGPRIIELDGNAAPCDRNPDAARIWLGEKMRSIFG